MSDREKEKEKERRDRERKKRTDFAADLEWLAVEHQQRRNGYREASSHRIMIQKQTLYVETS
jgi:hypothetical protein